MMDRSALYLATLPLLNSGRAQLLDSPRLVGQLCSLQRRTSSSGRQTVDYPRNGADDLANAACGALALVADPAANVVAVAPIVISRPRCFPGHYDGEGDTRAPHLFHADDYGL
jgi:hypothetical protein